MSAKFSKEPVKAQYQNTEHTFDLHFRSLWDWALELLDDEQIAAHFEWDAQKAFTFNGEKWVRFFNEPWTGTRWWDVQVHSIQASVSSHYLCQF